MTRTMLKTAARYWWLPVITGLLSIGLGIWCLVSPDTSHSTDLVGDVTKKIVKSDGFKPMY